MALVMAPECCFSTPRIIMQKWRASQITPTPSGLTYFLNGLRNLLREPLLDLQAARENVHNPRDLAQADDLVVGQVGHVHLAEEGQQMVLAQAEELDVLHHDHFVVLHFVKRAIHQLLNVRVVSAGRGT